MMSPPNGTRASRNPSLSADRPSVQDMNAEGRGQVRLDERNAAFMYYALSGSAIEALPPNGNARFAQFVPPHRSLLSLSSGHMHGHANDSFMRA